MATTDWSTGKEKGVINITVFSMAMIYVPAPAIQVNYKMPIISMYNSIYCVKATPRNTYYTRVENNYNGLVNVANYYLYTCSW